MHAQRRLQRMPSILVCYMDKPLPAGDCSVTATCSSVLELPALERTLLWSIRTWAAYHDAPQAVWRTLECVFTEAEIRPALEPFGQLMCALFVGLKRYPDIRCVRCLRMGKDENALLAILAAALEEPPQVIEYELGKLLLPAAARSGADAALAMMTVITDAGWHLQQPCVNTETTQWPPDFQHISMTTH
jgi:hypothetical protein